MYNILIVDDEKKEREGIALLLKRFDFPLKTTLAQNGEDALKIMEKNHFLNCMIFWRSTHRRNRQIFVRQGLF